MRNKQIEKVSQGLFIVTSVLAVCLLLLSAVVYPDLPAHVPIHVNFGARNSFGPRSSIFMWPAVLFEYLSTKLSISTTIWQMAEGIINHC